MGGKISKLALLPLRVRMYLFLMQEMATDGIGWMNDEAELDKAVKDFVEYIHAFTQGGGRHYSKTNAPSLRIRWVWTCVCVVPLPSLTRSTC